MAAHPATLSLVWNPNGSGEVWMINSIHRRKVLSDELGLLTYLGWTVDTISAQWFNSLPVA